MEESNPPDLAATVGETVEGTDRSEDVTPDLSAGGTDHAHGRDPGAKPAVRGDTIGRYVILDVLGRGGMGIVFAAFDPELDRKVALKLLLPRSGGSTSTTGRTRLLREAQAMAKLQHANVITVHDVGTHQHQVFVAMEFVDGRTLKHYQRENGRTRHEILAAYRAAGAGLAAAHEKGLVHRDFKPDNVLVGHDGRVLVLDFGLARPMSTETDALLETIAAPAPEASASHSALDTPLTLTGAVVGTPAFMSPEQHLGMPTDASSDQFSFCVALYEALYEDRPFGGDSMASLAFAVTQGRVREAPARTHVPAWLRRVLLRGLAVQPSERYSSMDALLAALAADPARRRKRVAVGVAAVAAGSLALFAGAQWQEARSQVCQGAEAALASVFDERARTEMRQAFALLPRGEEIYGHVDKTLAGWAGEFVAEHTEACEATQVRREQSAVVMDQRMACLDSRVRDFRALTQLFAEADGDVVAHAVEAAHALPSVKRCGDLEFLAANIAPPEDPALAAAVERGRETLARARALQNAGKYQGGMSIVAELHQDVAATYLPFLAEVEFQHGRLLAKSGRYREAAARLRDAYHRGDAAGDDHLSAAAAAELVHVVGYRLAEHGRGEAWARHGEAKVARTGDEAARADLANNLGTTYTAMGRDKDALRSYEEALEIRKRILRDDDPALGWTLNNLGATHWALDDSVKAEEFHREALALRERAFGELHPDVAASINNLAAVMNSRGDLEEGLRLHRRALEIRLATVGERHADTLASRNNIGSVLVRLDRPAEAQAELEEAYRQFAALFGAEHPTTILVRANLAEAALNAGDAAGALAHFEAVAAATEALPGRSEDDYVEALEDVARARQAMAKKRVARASGSSAP